MNNQQAQLEGSDEISLYEIYLILKRKRILILSVTVLCAFVAGAYSFIKPTNYTYQACAQMGVIDRDNTGQPIFIDSPQSAIAQLNNAYIPSVVDTFVKKHKLKLNTVDFMTFNPKDSSMVCIKTKAPKSIGGSVTNIQNASLQRLVDNNSRLAAVSMASAETNLKKSQSAAQTLSSKIANVVDQEHAVSGELSLLKTKDAVLQNQIGGISQEISRMRPLVEKASKNVHDNATALTMMIQNNQVAQERQQLFNLEMERSVALPKEQIGLLNQMNKLKRQETNLNAQIAANSAQIELDKASIKALQSTHIVRPSSPSIEPVGPGKAVFIVLGALVGLMLSVFYALLANAVTKQPDGVKTNLS
ncbi:Wzz/FepE/Etk N-terminal domain-containing protein [Acidithiobacillus ferridurans]|uniref:Polysaccharide chain length determinant N-terminal domain-containing protein n=4 Tax=Acidithiobacillus TaxID=119977 RepID=A0A8X8GB90_ACIFI|nr:Wzz/FepE/Etk N-terminal domain-containing protein [Acidithiobacillus ferridurans]MBU2722941.1 hypothetical protein [Acidithiobacillus ferridurans]